MAKRQKWVCEAIEHKLNGLPDREFHQILAEISEILYRQNASSKGCQKSTESSHDKAERPQERTGADG